VPISETAFIGLGVSAGVEGMRPIVELMFADFFGVCMGQIHYHMAKIQHHPRHLVSTGRHAGRVGMVAITDVRVTGAG
jgi:pyruvate/2-oxoglutarate/acetoin dehydrogenase E1 component